MALAPPQPRPSARAPPQLRAKSALPTSRPGDAAEREADATADRVMRAAAPQPLREPPAALPRAAAEPGAGPALALEHQAALGPGEPLPVDLRAELEPRFGQSLDRVRLLTDGSAAQAAASIGARAFTLGDRIAFATGEYQPTTPAGQWLLAHEIAHVLQQAPHTVPRQVFRDCVGACADAPAPPRRAASERAADRHRMQPQNGSLVDEGPTIRFDSVEVPGFKLQGHRGSIYSGRGTLAYQKNYRRGNPSQADVWRRDIDKSAIQTRLQSLLDASGLSLPAGASPAFEVPVAGRADPGSTTAALPGQRGPVYFGDVNTLAERLTIPQWGRGAERPPAKAFHVDHIVELQLSRWQREYASWPNTLANMELLDGRINQESGCIICKSIEGKLARHISAAAWPEGAEPTPQRLKRTHTVEFSQAVAGGRGPSSVGPSDFWKPDEIARAEHLAPLRVIDPSTLGGAGLVLVYPSGTGGNGKRFHTDFSQWSRRDRQWLKPFEITAKQFRTVGEGVGETGYFGFFEVALPEHPNFEGVTAPVRIERVPGAPFAGRIDKASVLANLRNIQFKGMSPMAFDDIEVDNELGLVGEGQVLPSLPLFEAADIRFRLRDGEAMLFKTFTLDEISAPPPLVLREASLTLFVSSRRGLGAEGRLDFGLRGAGNGFLAAEASTGGGIALAGGFDFDSRYFEPAQIRARYDLVSGRLQASGELGFKPGAVPGVRSGSLHAEFVDGVFSARGQIVPAVQGIEQVDLSASYSEAAGLQLHGDARVGNLPGVRGGTLAVDLARADEAAPWRLRAEGDLQPALPGIAMNLHALYDDGQLIARADAPFSIGERVSGRLSAGVANVPCDSEGQPQEGATPGAGLFAFGQGSATVRLSEQFQGDFGIRVGSDANLRISGGVGISQAITLFEQRRWERELLRFPTVSIPIFGVAVGGNVVGIAATIGGGLNAEASVGPGQIDQGRIGIEDWDPAQPDSLHVSGRVRFVVPAQAGLNGHLDAGISAGLAVIRATGGLSLQLGLGVDASASSELDLDWTPAQGLMLAAQLSASATPRMRASVNGFAEVVADAFVTSFTLWRRDYRLAERQFGSGLTVGVSVPLSWRQHGGLDFDFERVQFQVPDLSPDGALAALLQDEGQETERNEAAAR